MVIKEIQTKSDLVLRDLDLIKTFPDARVGFSINTLDESFKDDMDKAVSIGCRLDATKKLHDEGVRTTCFISPIFPAISDVPAIIDRVKDQCNLIWLENLNSRGSYKHAVIEYISSRLPKTAASLSRNLRKGQPWYYWENLDEERREYAKRNGLEYLRDADTLQKPFSAPPVMVNFFYHEEIKRSAKKDIKIFR